MPKIDVDTEERFISAMLSLGCRHQKRRKKLLIKKPDGKLVTVVAVLHELLMNGNGIISWRSGYYSASWGEVEFNNFQKNKHQR